MLGAVTSLSFTALNYYGFYGYPRRMPRSRVR